MRIYVGVKNGKRTMFRSRFVPTEKTHGHLYDYVVGPFDTQRGAEFFVKYGGRNPHCVTVYDAERLARRLAYRE